MMNDEIIETFNRCSSKDVNYNECPLVHSDYKLKNCKRFMQQIAINLINRQQAEIERLSKENKQILDNCEWCENKYVEQIINAKSETIKEFLEMLKNRNTTMDKGIMSIESVENLAKEMVETLQKEIMEME